ncbi:MAG: GNAT family N-acetyltransferase [Bacteroidetes bacterium]|nr:GNAT family N-acetyltransferase [Bacteroidota bacterium]
MNQIVLEKYKPLDQPFLEQVYYSTREEDLKQTNWSEQQKQQFIIMQFMAQKSDYERKFPNALQQLIYYKNQAAGRLYTNEMENNIHIIDIALLPQYRNKGIGQSLLKQLIVKAKEQQKTISLQVIKTNPAKHLYTRLGFLSIKEDGIRDYMEYR